MIATATNPAYAEENPDSLASDPSVSAQEVPRRRGQHLSQRVVKISNLQPHPLLREMKMFADSLSYPRSCRHRPHARCSKESCMPLSLRQKTRRAPPQIPSLSASRRDPRRTLEISSSRLPPSSHLPIPATPAIAVASARCYGATRTHINKHSKRSTEHESREGSPRKTAFRGNHHQTETTEEQKAQTPSPCQRNPAPPLSPLLKSWGP